MQSLPDFSERLFVRMLSTADDFGRGLASNLHATCFPLADIPRAKCVQALADLQKAGVVHAYTDGSGRLLFQIVKFNNPPRAKHSKYPSYEECAQLECNLQADCTQLADDLFATCKQDVAACMSKPKQKPKPKPETKTESSLFAATCEEIWAAYPQKVGKPQALEYLAEDLRAGAKKEDILAGVQRYIAFMVKARETFPDRAYKDGSAFFCKRNWKSEWTVGGPPPVEYDEHGWPK
jgi:hypothetical protein